jgi:hypothetical protein
MEGERVYTRMSGQAVKGLQRLVRGRKIYVRDDRDGFTVITKDLHARVKPGWAAKRKMEKLSA